LGLDLVAIGFEVSSCFCAAFCADRV